MPVINFKLSDDEKFQAIWALLNPEFNEEGNWTITYGISAVYEDYALVVNYETGEFNRAYYKKNDETDMVELGDIVKCYVLDVTENEKQTLDTLRALNGGTYELVSDVLVNAQDTLDKNSEFSAKIDELTSTIATLTTEKDEFSAQLETANANIEALTAENTSLQQYKLDIDTAQKNAVIDEYAEQLSDEILDAYRAKLDQYSVEELDMHLAYELKKSNPTVFSKAPDSGYVPKDTHVDGLTSILSKYKNN